LFIAGRFEDREKTLQIACKLAACLLATGTGGSAPRPMSLNSAAGLISGKGRQPPGAYRRSRAPAAGRPRNADMGRAQSRRPALPQIDEIRLAGLDPVDQPIPLRKECAEWRRMDEALLRFGIAVDRKGNADAAEQEFCFAPTEVEYVGLDLSEPVGKRRIGRPHRAAAVPNARISSNIVAPARPAGLRHRP